MSIKFNGFISSLYKIIKTKYKDIIITTANTQRKEAHDIKDTNENEKT